MKKLIIILIAALMLTLASCENQPQKEPASDTPAATTAAVTTAVPDTTIIGSDNMRDKLYLIKKGWSCEQVEELLGEPDDYIGAGLGDTYIYFISDTEKAYIRFDGIAGAENSPSVLIENTETGEAEYIIEPFYKW